MLIRLAQLQLSLRRFSIFFYFARRLVDATQLLIANGQLSRRRTAEQKFFRNKFHSVQNAEH